jgi:hypothetical protein
MDSKRSDNSDFDAVKLAFLVTLPAKVWKSGFQKIIFDSPQTFDLKRLTHCQPFSKSKLQSFGTMVAK